jgi:hypothetical protein
MAERDGGADAAARRGSFGCRRKKITDAIKAPMNPP